jgi:hypothetical protein
MHSLEGSSGRERRKTQHSLFANFAFLEFRRFSICSVISYLVSVGWRDLTKRRCDVFRVWGSGFRVWGSGCRVQ